MSATTVAVAFIVSSLMPEVAGARTADRVRALPMAAFGTTNSAVPLVLWAKKKKKKKSTASGDGAGLSPESAETKRQAIRDAVSGARQSGDLEKVAEDLESNAAILGDPVTFIEAADTRLELADEERSIDEAERAIETSRVALDILHFYERVGSGEVHTDWRVIDPSDAGTLISQAEGQIARAEALIEAIEREQEVGEEAPIAAAPTDTPKKRKKKKRGKAAPGSGLIAGGSVFIALGAAGAGLGIAGLAISASKQKEVEKLMLPDDQEEVDRLDQEGHNANLMGWVGLGAAAVGLAVGVPLLVVGVNRRKGSSATPANALRVAPAIGGDHAGLVISGRF